MKDKVNRGRELSYARGRGRATIHGADGVASGQCSHSSLCHLCLLGRRSKGERVA